MKAKKNQGTRYLDKKEIKKPPAFPVAGHKMRSMVNIVLRVNMALLSALCDLSEGNILGGDPFLLRRVVFELGAAMYSVV